jgi:HlyD family secretion protein
MAVPSKALRFIPNEALLTEQQKVEDCEGDFKVWTKEGDVFKAHKVEVGTTNGLLTEIISGIAEGSDVLVDFTIDGGDGADQDQQAQNPFMPRPRNNRQQQGQQKK